MKLTMHQSSSQQRGAVLVIALIMLLLVTMIGVAGIRASTMEERMAGNARDRDKALQAAEAVVRSCLNQVMSIPPTYAGTILSPATSGATHWNEAANWEPGSTNSIAVTMDGAGLANAPRCMVERLGAGDNFRVTGRAVGGSSSTVVMLQATYSTE